MTTTRVSWPATIKPPKRRFELVYSWEPPVRDPVDPVTGEPATWERGHVRSFIAEALDVLRRLPMPPGELPADPGCAWPLTIKAVAEAYGYDKSVVTKGASPAEVVKMDRTLAWFWYLPRVKDPVIVSGFALGMSSRRIGKMIHKSYEYCRLRDRLCLELIAERLNQNKVIDNISRS